MWYESAWVDTHLGSKLVRNRTVTQVSCHTSSRECYKVVKISVVKSKTSEKLPFFVINVIILVWSPHIWRVYAWINTNIENVSRFKESWLSIMCVSCVNWNIVQWFLFLSKIFLHFLMSKNDLRSNQTFLFSLFWQDKIQNEML